MKWRLRVATKAQMLRDADNMERQANGLLSGSAKDKEKARNLLIKVRRLRINAERVK